LAYLNFYIDVIIVFTQKTTHFTFYPLLSICYFHWFLQLLTILIYNYQIVFSLISSTTYNSIPYFQFVLFIHFSTTFRGYIHLAFFSLQLLFSLFISIKCYFTSYSLSFIQTILTSIKQKTSLYKPFKKRYVNTMPAMNNWIWLLRIKKPSRLTLCPFQISLTHNRLEGLPPKW
jgi:hypothetical protein